MHSNLLLRKPTDSKLYVEDVFSTWLYTGNGSTQTITNGIDLSGKGGLVWIKARNQAYSHNLIDTARGSSNLISSNDTGGNQFVAPPGWITFLSSGFTDRSFTGSGDTYASWTFRKAPKFFDVVTFTGTTSSNQRIQHSLGVVPGLIIVKVTSGTSHWYTWHRSLSSATDSYLHLNTTQAAATTSGRWGTSGPTATDFGIDSANYIGDGATAVAYLFAHDTTADGVIQCGSFTTDGSGSATVNLGYEPQFILVKASSAAENWNMFDVMRGMPASPGGASRLSPNTSSAESGAVWGVNPTAIGFTVSLNASTTYIYMAIRRGPMRVPTDATKVFSPIAYSGNSSDPRTIGSLNAVDMAFNNGPLSTGNLRIIVTRLLGGENYLFTDGADPEGSGLSGWKLEQTGQIINGIRNASGSNYIEYLFRRATGFFDVVCFTTSNSTNQRITHNLGVAPELIITKNRSASGNWYSYVAALGRSKYISVNTTAASNGFGNDWGTSDPTSTDFGYNTQIFQSSPYSGRTAVAYLFASCPGVSKVGSYTGTGTTLQINCGFTNGARFVLIKRTDSTGDWYVYDSARGIVSGNDPYQLLNSTVAEVTSTDYINPLSTGFELSSTAPAALNASGGTYIYLAIA